MAKLLSNDDRLLDIKTGALDYIELKQLVQNRKLLEKRPGFYLVFIFSTYVAFIGSLVAYYYSNSWITMVISLILVCFFRVQMGGIMHDSGHRAISNSVWKNNLLGHIAATLLGISFGDWRPRHDNHHAHTNEEEHDTDLMIPVLSYTQSRLQKKKGIEKFLVRFQHYIYFFLACFATFSIQLDSLKNILSKRDKHVYWEAALFIAGVSLWLILPFIIFPLPKALVFVLLGNVLASQYIMHVFAPNHKGMPELPAGVKLSFVEQQIVTSRNVQSSPLFDYFYLGLNYQIEHHLFPNCPRPSLKKIMPLVKSYCQKRGLPYEVVKPWQVDTTIFKDLKTIAIKSATV